jgi:hypothetical protein
MSFTSLIPFAGKLIDKLIPDKSQAEKAKLELIRLEQTGELEELRSATSIITAEAKSEHWLTSNWRPLTMLTFVLLIVAHWLGFTADNLSEDQVLSLLEIVKVGLGGYVIGRSVEKATKEWKK